MNRTTQIKAVTPTIVVTEARAVVFIHMLVHGFGSRDINVSFAIFCKELQPPIRRNFVRIEDMKWHGELDPISKTVEESAASSSLNLNSLLGFPGQPPNTKIQNFPKSSSKKTKRKGIK